MRRKEKKKKKKWNEKYVLRQKVLVLVEDTVKTSPFFSSFLISKAHNLMRIKKNGMTARPSVKGAVYGEGSPGFLGCFFLPRLLASREKKNNNKLSKLKVQPFTGQTHRLGVKNSNA